MYISLYIYEQKHHKKAVDYYRMLRGSECAFCDGMDVYAQYCAKR